MVMVMTMVPPGGLLLEVALERKFCSSSAAAAAAGHKSRARLRLRRGERLAVGVG